MPRIEQMPNGTYVRRLNGMEQQIINRLYKEVVDRKDSDSAMLTRIGELESKVTTLTAELSNTKIRLAEVIGK